jgi:hypothetical protein
MHTDANYSGQRECLKMRVHVKRDMHTDAKYICKASESKWEYTWGATCILMQSKFTRLVPQGESIREWRHAYWWRVHMQDQWVEVSVNGKSDMHTDANYSGQYQRLNVRVYVKIGMHTDAKYSWQGQWIKVKIYVKSEMHTDAKYSGQSECLKVRVHA